MSTSGTRAPAGRRRRQWTAAEKTACLRAFAASGQSATAFCRERGVPRATLTLWRRTARPPSPSALPCDGGAPFARVEVVAAQTPPAPPARTAAPTPAAGELTLALRTPAGLEAVVTGFDLMAAIAVLRGVLAAPPVAGGVA
jgi:transposase-like protein